MCNTTYIQSLDSITANDLYEGLMLEGMFTEKLPNIFTMEDFCKFIKNAKFTQDEDYKKLAFNYIPYESMRDINVPRLLGVPNPFGYRNLCEFLSENWDTIKKHFRDKTSAQAYKVSQIHIRKIQDSKKIFQMKFPNDGSSSELNIELMSGMRYMVKTDISSCFPSMYSHALAWALVGKKVAKRNSNNQKKWYNKLDFFTRNLKNRETHGFLIGPHASNILSEIILTAIDYELKKYSYLRYIDDYTCYVESYEKAQEFILDLSKCLRDYGLFLNHKKTRIVELPDTLSERWKLELNPINFSLKDNELSLNQVLSYIDKAILLTQKNDGKSSPINYAVKTLSSYRKSIQGKTKEYYIKRVLNLALLRPYLVPILYDYLIEPFNVESQQLSTFVKDLYKIGVTQSNFEVCIYALYYAIVFDIRIESTKLSKKSIESDNCFFMLFAYIYLDQIQDSTQVSDLYKHANDLLTKSKQAQSSQKYPIDMDPYWIFIYEVLPISDLPYPWNELKFNNNKISFIKPIIEWNPSNKSNLFEYN